MTPDAFSSRAALAYYTRRTHMKREGRVKCCARAERARAVGVGPRIRCAGLVVGRLVCPRLREEVRGPHRGRDRCVRRRCLEEIEAIRQVVGALVGLTERLQAERLFGEPEDTAELVLLMRDVTAV